MLPALREVTSYVPCVTRNVTSKHSAGVLHEKMLHLTRRKDTNQPFESRSETLGPVIQSFLTSDSTDKSLKCDQSSVFQSCPVCT